MRMPRLAAPRPAARLAPEQLEDRAVPALMTTWVNDNWNLFLDADSSGGLSAGDVVTTANDPGPVTGYFYGTQAFGTVTSGIGVTTPESISGAATIQDAVTNTNAGGTVNVFGGTYNEDVNLNKALTLLGVGAGTTTVAGAIGGDSATIRVSASGVTVAGLTITRQGNTVADWNDPGLNSAGVAVQGQSITGLTVRDNIITGNRTGIDVNNSSGHTIRNNVITANRTGLIFRNQTNGLLVTENFITNNFTVGIVFLDASSGTNSPLQQALNSTFTGNNISGNWYGQIVDRQVGGSLPAAGTTNLKNFSGNWFGTTAPVITTADTAEPGYSAQIPVQFGGTGPNATAPTTPQPDIAGAGSANFDISPMLTTGVDTDPTTFGFQGDFSQLTVTQQLASADGLGRIQEGINRVTAGGTVTVPAGTYNESPTVNKSLTLQGAGRDTTTIDLLQPGTPGAPYTGALTITGAGNSVTVDGFTIAGHSAIGTGLANTNVYVDSGLNTVVISNNRLEVGMYGAGTTGDDGFGLITAYTTTPANFIGDLRVTGNVIVPADGVQAGRPFFINTGVDQFLFDSNTITGDFARGAFTSALDGTVSNNTYTGTDTTPGARSGGFGTFGYPDQAFGKTAFVNNTVSNTAFGISVYGTNGVSLSGNTISGTDTGLLVSNVYAVAGFDPSTLSVAGNTFSNNVYHVAYTDANSPGGEVSVAGNTFDGVALDGSTTSADLFAIADKVLDKVDAPGNGLVRLRAGNVYVTTNSFFAPDTTAPSIQRAVDAASVGDTVTVADGTYTENVTIGKNLTLVSANGRAATTIQGVTGVGALGTVVVTGTTSGVTIGGTGQGFTIQGIDNGNPAIENAAVYVKGTHTGAQILGNEIVANGDEGLLVEYGATVSGFVIDGNIFSGQTFIGAPADNGFGNQFSTPNVPRQLVVIGNGGGDAASAKATDITFTNNQITGTAGGTNVGGEQGNSLVTIDAANSTITGNTFDGTTTRFGVSLRVRRPGTTISGNTFLSTNMGAATEHLFVQNNTTALQDTVAANTFDRGAYVDGGSDLSVSLNGGAGRAASGQTLRVLAGTYDESLNLTATGTGALNTSLVLAPDGGAVNITGDLALDADDGIVLDVSGAAPDQINVTGAVALGGTLTINGLAGVPEGASPVLIGNGGADAVTGTLTGFPEGTVITAPDGRQFTLSYAGGTGNDLALVSELVVIPPGPVGPAGAAPVYLTAVGADAGASGHVKVYNADGSLRFSFLAFAGFDGGVRVATGDVNGDGVDDIVVGAGPGAAGGHVKVFDGATGSLISSFLAFPGFSGGVNVAVGDIDGDGDDDIVVGTGFGAAHVKAFDFATGALVSSFIAFDGFTGGVTVAAGNFDGTGADEIVVGAATTASHVKVFGQTGNVFASFLAFPASNGVTVAAGDLDGDTFAELVVGSGPGSNGQVNVYSGRTAALRGSIPPIAGTNGARVAVGFANSDAMLDILVGTGAGSPALVRSFDGTTLAALGSFSAFDGFLGGLFVG
ncbi:MAG TPA: right-handed parallel beta-helix repeat-containing protein [Gemmata sp.]